MCDINFKLLCQRTKQAIIFLLKSLIFINYFLMVALITVYWMNWYYIWSDLLKNKKIVKKSQGKPLLAIYVICQIRPNRSHYIWMFPRFLSVYATQWFRISDLHYYVNKTSYNLLPTLFDKNLWIVCTSNSNHFKIQYVTFLFINMKYESTRGKKYESTRKIVLTNWNITCNKINFLRYMTRCSNKILFGIFSGLVLGR